MTHKTARTLLRQALTSAQASVLLVLVSASTVYASGGASGGSHEVHGPDKAYAFAMVNFVIFAVLLVKFLRKPLQDLAQKRHDELAAVVEQVQAERQALAQEKEELEAAAARFENTRKDRLDSVREAAESEARHIMEEARHQADSILKDAQMRAKGMLQSSQEEAVESFVKSLVGELGDRFREKDAAEMDKAFVSRVQDSVRASVTEGAQ